MNSGNPISAYEYSSILAGEAAQNMAMNDITPGPMGQARVDLQGPDEPRCCQEIIGLDVISHIDGTRLGRVLDVLFDLDANRAVALILDDHHWMDVTGLRIVPWSLISFLGHDAILVVNQDAKMPLRQDQWSLRAVVSHWESAFSSTRVLREDGECLCTLADMCIDESSGFIIGCESPDGFQPETLRGKDFVPAPPAAHRADALNLN